MDSNKLRARVALYLPAAGVDAEGQPAGAMQLLDVVPADVRYDSGLGAIRSGADLSVLRASIRVRYLAAALTVKWARHAGVTFNVLSVLPDEGRQEWLDLVCEAVR